jgi:hypothetical protein
MPAGREGVRERSFEPQDLQRQIKYAQDGVGSFQSQLAFGSLHSHHHSCIRPCPSQGRQSPKKKFLALNFETRGRLGNFWPLRQGLTNTPRVVASRRYCTAINRTQNGETEANIGYHWLASVEHLQAKTKRLQMQLAIS